ncbi:hypothetical protein D0T66_09190 [Dysgonomonas sp. 25]|nr:hypothetical protein [Dysgonomonas sp. 25]
MLSCSRVDSDAKEAAEAVQKSIAYTAEGKLDKAEEYYKIYKNIDARYQGTDEYIPFREAYQQYISAKE